MFFENVFNLVFLFCIDEKFCFNIFKIFKLKLMYDYKGM